MCSLVWPPLSSPPEPCSTAGRAGGCVTGLLGGSGNGEGGWACFLACPLLSSPPEPCSEGSGGDQVGATTYERTHADTPISTPTHFEARRGASNTILKFENKLSISAHFWCSLLVRTHLKPASELPQRLC